MSRLLGLGERFPEFSLQACVSAEPGSEFRIVDSHELEGTLLKRSLYAAIAVSLLVASSAGAQATFEAGPLFGYYRPTANYDPATVYSTDLPDRPKDLSGAAFGGEARLWFSPRFGAQVQVALTSSTRDSLFTPGGSLQPPSARVITATMQMLYSFAPQGKAIRTWLSAGPGLVHHGGRAYSEYGSPTSPAGAVGLGGSVPLTAGFRVSAGVTALLYWFEVEMPTELRANGDVL
jgi:hypothetical protein